MIKSGDGFIMILNLDKVFTTEEVGLINKATEIV
jgi:hypothetical protein